MEILILIMLSLFWFAVHSNSKNKINESRNGFNGDDNEDY